MALLRIRKKLQSSIKLYATSLKYLIEARFRKKGFINTNKNWFNV